MRLREGNPPARPVLQGERKTLTIAFQAAMQNRVAAEEHDPRERPQLIRDEVESFLDAISAAHRQWRMATLAIREEFGLKLRGLWILNLIHTGQVTFPADLARLFQCSPGLITGELNRLIAAGLVAARTYELDARQLELTVTPLGEAVDQRIGIALGEWVQERLAGYTKAEVMRCAHLLRDFATAPNPASL